MLFFDFFLPSTAVLLCTRISLVQHGVDGLTEGATSVEIDL